MQRRKKSNIKTNKNKKEDAGRCSTGILYINIYTHGTMIC